MSYRYNQKRRKRRKQKRKNKAILVFAEILLLIGLIIAAKVFLFDRDRLKVAHEVTVPDWIDVQLVDEGNPSRSGVELDGIDDIVVHYVGNPGTTAQQNRDFYNHEDSNVSSHFVVGLDGEVIMCLPLYEKSAASNDRNHDTISIEVCHPDETGKFTDSSYESLVRLVDWLMKEFRLSSDNVIRHYDVTGKVCPKYFVDNPEAWEEFKRRL